MFLKFRFHYLGINHEFLRIDLLSFLLRFFFLEHRFPGEGRLCFDRCLRYRSGGRSLRKDFFLLMLAVYAQYFLSEVLPVMHGAVFAVQGLGKFTYLSCFVLLPGLLESFAYQLEDDGQKDE